MGSPLAKRELIRDFLSGLTAQRNKTCTRPPAVRRGTPWRPQGKQRGEVGDLESAEAEFFWILRKMYCNHCCQIVVAFQAVVVVAAGDGDGGPGGGGGADDEVVVVV